MSTPLVRMWYAVLVAFISALVVAGTCLVYTAQMQDRADKRWCALLNNLGDAYRQNPPQTPTGRRQAAEIDNLRTQFGCQSSKE